MRCPEKQESELIDEVLANPTTDLIDIQREIVLANSRNELGLAVDKFIALTAHEVNKRGLNVHKAM